VPVNGTAVSLGGPVRLLVLVLVLMLLVLHLERPLGLGAAAAVAGGGPWDAGQSLGPCRDGTMSAAACLFGFTRLLGCC